MAKVKVECTCRNCGRTFEVVAFKNNRKEADNYEKWAIENITECEDCRKEAYKEQMKNEAVKNLAEANENGWPELTGSEKQVMWAATIRSDCMKAVSSVVPENMQNAFWKYALEIMNEHTAAAWWIDNRTIIKKRIKELVVEKEKASAEEVKSDESTIAEPAEKKHEGCVKIDVQDKAVNATYQRNEEFIQIVKNLGYKWDGKTWMLEIGATTGTNEERASELGNHLLNAGFSIMVQNPAVLKNAVEGNYNPRTYRWISKLSKEEKFVIRWGKDDDLYKVAKSLPKARYKSGTFEVPVTEVDAVIDFASAYDFKFTKGAQEVIDSIKKVVPADVKRPEYKEENIKDILNSSREVLEDLKD